MKRSQFNQYLDKIMGNELIANARKLDTSMPNGLQITGSDEVKKIATGVSLSVDLIQQALEQGADTIIVHHGIRFSFPYNLVMSDTQLRLKLLLENNLNLYAYHYCLDAHPTLGNNAQIAKLLKADITDSYFDSWGFIAKLKKDTTVQKLAEEYKKVLDHDVFAVDAHREQKIKTLAILSGGAVPHTQALFELLEKDVEVLVTGMVQEWIPHQFLELGMSYLAGGHYATETFGIKALTERIKKDLKGKIKIEFLDLVNPL